MAPEEDGMSMHQEAPPTPSPEATAVLAALSATLADWRAAHPQATFAEIEAVVETQVAQLRAQLIADALPTDAAPSAGSERPTCPRCAVGLVRRGTHRRTVRVVGDAPVTVTRAYWTCPRCGDGLFPLR